MPKSLKEVYDEIIANEDSYISSLFKLIEAKNRLVNIHKGHYKADADIIFANIDAIYELHKNFVAALRKDPDRIPELFSEYADYFQLYVQFVNGYDESATVLNRLSSERKFKSFLKTLADHMLKNEPLSSVLIRPIQHVPRYGLFVGELEKIAAERRNDVKFRQRIATMREVVDSMAARVNNKRRERELAEELLELHPKIRGCGKLREKLHLIDYAVVALFDKKWLPRGYYLFLTSDRLLWTDEKLRFKDSGDFMAIKSVKKPGPAELSIKYLTRDLDFVYVSFEFANTLHRDRLYDGLRKHGTMADGVFEGHSAGGPSKEISLASPTNSRSESSARNAKGPDASKSLPRPRSSQRRTKSFDPAPRRASAKNPSQNDKSARARELIKELRDLKSKIQGCDDLLGKTNLFDHAVVSINDNKWRHGHHVFLCSDCLIWTDEGLRFQGSARFITLTSLKKVGATKFSVLFMSEMGSMSCFTFQFASSDIRDRWFDGIRKRGALPDSMFEEGEGPVGMGLPKLNRQRSSSVDLPSGSHNSSRGGAVSEHGNGISSETLRSRTTKRDSSSKQKRSKSRTLPNTVRSHGGFKRDSTFDNRQRPTLGRQGSSSLDISSVSHSRPQLMTRTGRSKTTTQGDSSSGSKQKRSKSKTLPRKHRTSGASDSLHMKTVKAKTSQQEMIELTHSLRGCDKLLKHTELHDHAVVSVIDKAHHYGFHVFLCTDRLMWTDDKLKFSGSARFLSMTSVKTNGPTKLAIAHISEAAALEEYTFEFSSTGLRDHWLRSVRHRGDLPDSIVNRKEQATVKIRASAPPPPVPLSPPKPAPSPSPFAPKREKKERDTALGWLVQGLSDDSRVGRSGTPRNTRKSTSALADKIAPPKAPNVASPRRARSRDGGAQRQTHAAFGATAAPGGAPGAIATAAPGAPPGVGAERRRSSAFKLKIVARARRDSNKSEPTPQPPPAPSMSRAAVSIPSAGSRNGLTLTTAGNSRSGPPPPAPMTSHVPPPAPMSAAPAASGWNVSVTPPVSRPPTSPRAPPPHKPQSRRPPSLSSSPSPMQPARVPPPFPGVTVSTSPQKPPTIVATSSLPKFPAAGGQPSPKKPPPMESTRVPLPFAGVTVSTSTRKPPPTVGTSSLPKFAAAGGQPSPKKPPPMESTRVPPPFTGIVSPRKPPPTVATSSLPKNPAGGPPSSPRLPPRGPPGASSVKLPQGGPSGATSPGLPLSGPSGGSSPELRPRGSLGASPTKPPPKVPGRHPLVVLHANRKPPTRNQVAQPTVLPRGPPPPAPAYLSRVPPTGTLPTRPPGVTLASHSAEPQNLSTSPLVPNRGPPRGITSPHMPPPSPMSPPRGRPAGMPPHLQQRAGMPPPRGQLSGMPPPRRPPPTRTTATTFLPMAMPSRSGALAAPTRPPPRGGRPPSSAPTLSPSTQFNFKPPPTRPAPAQPAGGFGLTPPTRTLPAAPAGGPNRS